MVPLIRLRPVDAAELDNLLRFLWDAEATGEFQWFGYRMNSARNLKTRWDEDGLISDTAPSFLAVALEDGNAAGWVTWRPIGSFATLEIGIALFAEHRGRGVGRTAQQLLVDYLFDTTTVHRIQASTEADNVVEQRALESVGFLHEGVQRHLYLRAGEWRDSVMYGLLRADSAVSGRP
jgi:[ribosomal protein S5]-alanine N-acetyltransferase